MKGRKKKHKSVRKIKTTKAHVVDGFIKEIPSQSAAEMDIVDDRIKS